LPRSSSVGASCHEAQGAQPIIGSWANEDGTAVTFGVVAWRVQSHAAEQIFDRNGKALGDATYTRHGATAEPDFLPSLLLSVAWPGFRLAVTTFERGVGALVRAGARAEAMSIVGGRLEAAVLESSEFRLPRSVGAARNPVYDRFEAAVARNGGKLAEGGAAFPSRRAARQAASEIAGDMGSAAKAVRASDYRGAPWTWRNSQRVIGRESADGTVYWRDDSLGHPQFGMGPHVNVGVDGIDFHL